MPKTKAKNTKKQRKGETIQVMAGNYPVGDFLVRLKNSCLAGKKTAEVPSTKLIKSVAKTLASLGFIEEVSENKGILSVRLTYRKKEPVLTEVKLISKPGLRMYMGVSELEKRKDPSVLILSTPVGVMSSKEAIKKRVGGEVIAEVL
jgi:small subunit ribosomal protein S8